MVGIEDFVMKDLQSSDHHKRQKLFAFQSIRKLYKYIIINNGDTPVTLIHAINVS